MLEKLYEKLAIENNIEIEQDEHQTKTNQTKDLLLKILSNIEKEKKFVRLTSTHEIYELHLLLKIKYFTIVICIENFLIEKKWMV